MIIFKLLRFRQKLICFIYFFEMLCI